MLESKKQIFVPKCFTNHSHIIYKLPKKLTIILNYLQIFIFISYMLTKIIILLFTLAITLNLKHDSQKSQSTIKKQQKKSSNKYIQTHQQKKKKNNKYTILKSQNQQSSDISMSDSDQGNTKKVKKQMINKSRNGKYLNKFYKLDNKQLSQYDSGQTLYKNTTIDKVIQMLKSKKWQEKNSQDNNSRQKRKLHKTKEKIQKQEGQSLDHQKHKSKVIKKIKRENNMHYEIDSLEAQLKKLEKKLDGDNVQEMKLNKKGKNQIEQIHNQQSKQSLQTKQSEQSQKKQINKINKQLQKHQKILNIKSQINQQSQQSDSTESIENQITQSESKENQTKQQEKYVDNKNKIDLSKLKNIGNRKIYKQNIIKQDSSEDEKDKYQNKDSQSETEQQDIEIRVNGKFPAKLNKQQQQQDSQQSEVEQYGLVSKQQSKLQSKEEQQLDELQIEAQKENEEQQQEKSSDQQKQLSIQQGNSQQKQTKQKKKFKKLKLNKQTTTSTKLTKSQKTLYNITYNIIIKGKLSAVTLQPLLQKISKQQLQQFKKNIKQEAFQIKKKDKTNKSKNKSSITRLQFKNLLQQPINSQKSTFKTWFNQTIGK